MDLGTALVWVALIVVGLPLAVQLLILFLGAVGICIIALVHEIKEFIRIRKN